MQGNASGAGLVLAARFRCQQLLKRGHGMATWLATDLDDDRRLVVVKTVGAEGVPVATRTRLEHEAHVLRRLEGPFTQPVVAWGRDDEMLYLVQAFVEGETLRERLGRGPMATASALRVGIDVAQALQGAHDLEVLHRDVKPANVVVDDADPVTRAVLIDFGLARSAGLDPSVRDEPVGTARYLAPEAAGLLDVVVDERADLYSFGVMLFECLAGRPPFEGTDVGEVLRQHLTVAPPPLRSLSVAVPRVLDDVVRRLLHKDPGERYQSAAAVLADLEEIESAMRRGVAEPILTAGLHDRRTALSEPAFVGRPHELAVLERVLDEARAGQGGLVLLEATSGGGKTRLLDELAARARPSAWILRGQGVDQAAQRPFQLLEGLAQGIVASAGSEVGVGERLRRRLVDWSGGIVAALPDLGDTLGTADAARLGPEDYGETRSVESLAALLDALGSPEQPALVLLDDCQWADGLTARLLARWQERPSVGSGHAGSRHTVVVAAFRSEEVGPEHILRAVDPRARVELGPLAGGDIRRLCESMAGELPDEAVATLVRLAEGSPFMASAVVRGMVESGALRPEATGWEVEDEAMAAVQTSRRAALFLVRRLELLAPAALDLLTVGAVLGKQFDLSLALELTGHRAGEAEVDGALADARRRHILWTDTSSGVCTFSHDKLREALLLRLGPAEHQALHRQAASTIEGRHPDRLFELAYHYDAGGEAERALPYALRAAALARTQNALEVAATHYLIAEAAAESTSADAATRARISEDLGDVLTLRGDYTGAVERLEVARKLAQSPVARATLEGKLGDVAFKRGEPLAARLWLEGALRNLGRWVPRRTVGYLAAVLWEALVQAAHTALPRLLLHRRTRDGADEEFLAIRLYSRLAYVYWFHSGKIPCGWAHLREMNLAERYPPSAALAQAYSEHAPVMTMIPWYKRGIAYAERSLAIRQDIGDLWGQGQSLNFYGVVLYAASRYRDCMDKCREAVRLLQRTGDRWEEHTALWHLAFCHYRTGELDKAVELARHVHAAGLEIGDSAAVGISLSAWSRASGGRIPADMVRAELDRDNEDAHTATAVHVAEAVRLLGEARIEEAAEVLEEAVAIVRRTGLRQEYVMPVYPWLATARRLQAEAVAPYAVAERRRAIRRAARAARRATRIARHYRNNGPHALRERALVAGLRSRGRRARRLLEASLALADAQGARYEHALTEHARARLGVTLGWPGATDALAAAESELDALASLGAPQQAAVLVDEPASLSITDRFTGLLTAARAIASAPSQEAVYAAVRNAAVSLLRGERCHIVGIDSLLGDGPGDDITTVSGEGVAEVSGSLVHRAVESGAPVVASEGEPDVTESMVLAGVRSSLVAPIRCEERVVACFCVVHRQVGSLFADEEVQLAELVATLAGAALEHVAGSEARYRSLALNSTDVVTIVDGDGRIDYLSSSVERVFGFEADELLGSSLASWLHPDDAERVLDTLRDTTTGADGSTRVQCRLRNRDGSWRHVETSVTNLLDDPVVRGLVLNTRDVSDRVALETELRNRAWYDSLTGLVNRTLFADRLDQAMRARRRSGTPLAVLFLDLDDFKSLNDTMGHAAGDLLLKDVGHRLQQSVRPDDTVARFGGDEFAVLLDNADPAVAERVAGRIVSELTKPFPVLGRDVQVRASVGVAVATDPSVSAEDLLGNADAAMYAAKAQGKDRYVVSDASMRTAVAERSGLRTDLAWAVERCELQLHYQPVIEVATGAVTGFEALVRWQHPERGLLAPLEFIGLAEETGLIVPIGVWVLKEACRQAQSWQAGHAGGTSPAMAVNVSARQLQDPGLVGEVAAALAESGLDPSRLVLEITESATVPDSEATIARLRALKDLGVLLAIDDFGTGYSTLSYLRRFPVDLLKIDRSFVAGLGHDADDVAIVASVIGLAHAFGLQVVAEGVETVLQLEELTRLSCDYAQGYNWRRPSSFDETERWLDAVYADRGAGTSGQLRVLLVDDRPSVRAAIEVAMDVHGGFVVVGQASDGREAVAMADDLQPDLVVLDLVMPGQGGLDALAELRHVAPRTEVVLLTATDALDVPAEAIGQTLGLFDKTADLTTLVDRLADVSIKG